MTGINKIMELRDQIMGMNPTPRNLQEALAAICNLMNDIQRELDDLDNYRMEQRERA